MDNNKKIPVLRFPEFSGEWKRKTLGELFKIVVGFVGTVSTFYCDKSDGIPFIRTLNVKNGWFSLDEIQYITNEFHIRNKKSQIYNDDILIARVGANMGMVCTVRGLEKEANSANVIIIKKNPKNNSDFYSAYLNSPKGQKQIQSKGAGGAQEVLNISVANTIIVPIPHLQEQQKIADFLTQIDNKINQLSQKKQLLESYKKGVMQRIFIQEIRFKDDDGREFPKWEDKKLGDICKITTGSSNRVDSSVDSGNYTFFDRSQDIRTSDIYLFDCEAVIVAGEGQEFIPKHFIGKFDLHQRTYAIMDFEKINGKYIFYYIHYFRAYFLSQAVGSTVKSLRLPMFQKMPIKLPFLEEQSKITNFLSALDERIAIVEKQLNGTKQYKKGLLQQLFI